jgi:hypothetical protein
VIGGMVRMLGTKCPVLKTGLRGRLIKPSNQADHLNPEQTVSDGVSSTAKSHLTVTKPIQITRLVANSNQLAQRGKISYSAY